MYASTILHSSGNGVCAGTPATPSLDLQSRVLRQYAYIHTYVHTYVRTYVHSRQRNLHLPDDVDVFLCVEYALAIQYGYKE